MSTIYTPEFVEAHVEVKTQMAARVANVPPDGTRIRATLGRTVIYATVRGNNNDQHSTKALNISIEPTDDGHRSLLDTYIWYSNGWVIEVLDDEAAEGEDA